MDMTENILGALLNCIPPGSVLTRTDKGVDAIYTTREENNLSEFPLVHIKESAIVNLEAIKSSVEDQKMKIIHSENEWIVYKPRI